MMYSVYNNFNQYKNLADDILRKMLAAHPQGALDEQGVPAYVDGLYWSRLIFWKRIQITSKCLQREQGGKCVDFGCGTGLMLPLLNPLFDTIYAVDLSLNYTREFIALWIQSVHQQLSNVYLSEKIEELKVQENSIDMILALDSLEHVDNLKDVILKMKNLLKSDGHILISGPTENFIYRIGRKIVGFSGHYHVRSIYDIKQEIEKHFQIRSITKIGFPFTLFLLIDAQKR